QKTDKEPHHFLCLWPRMESMLAAGVCCSRGALSHASPASFRRPRLRALRAAGRGSNDARRRGSGLLGRAALRLSALSCGLLLRLVFWPRELRLDLRGAGKGDGTDPGARSPWASALLGRFGFNASLRRMRRLLRAQEVELNGEEVDLGCNPALLLLVTLLLVLRPVAGLLGLWLLFLLSATKLRDKSAKSSLSFAAKISAEDLWSCRIWRSCANAGLRDVMQNSIAGLIAELSDLQQATSFNVKGIQ
ncbi:unnamed protein product, partial [Effrenium voratum]